MSCYAMFTSKKGRPKTLVDVQLPQSNFVITKSGESQNMDADVIMSLFYLNKITKEQVDSAHFYETMCREYYNSIDSPIMRTGSVIKMNEKHTSLKVHSSERDQEALQKWIDIRSELSCVDGSCEDILYKVIIENKLKYELLNPVSVTKNILKIFKSGIDRITNYRSDNALYHRI